MIAKLNSGCVNIKEGFQYSEWKFKMDFWSHQPENVNFEPVIRKLKIDIFDGDQV